MTAREVQQNPVAPASPPAPTVRPERLAREFEDLGLGPAEARVIVALLQLGSAKSAQVAKAANVPRTGIYQLIESLQEKGLVLRVPAGGPAMWTTPGQDKILDRLHSALLAAQQERVQQHALRATILRELLAEALPAPEPVNLPFVHAITCPAEMREHHERLFQQATQEALAFTRPPFSTEPDNAYTSTMAALARGVSMRAIYQAAQTEDPEATAFRASADGYAAAGVQARVVDVLPVKLLVVDRKVAILALDNPQPHIEGLGITLLIEHPGFATLLAELFEHYWATGRPYGDETRHEPSTSPGEPAQSP